MRPPSLVGLESLERKLEMCKGCPTANWSAAHLHFMLIPANDIMIVRWSDAMIL